MVLRLTYVTSWLLFLLVILLLGWDDARSYHVVIGTFALPGVVVGVVWTLRGSKWDYGALAMSAVVLLAYFAWWQIEISDRYDSSPGLLSAVAMQLRIPRLLFQQRLVQEDAVGALAEAYWQLGMPVLQMVLAVQILRGIFDRRNLPSGHAV